MTSNSENQITRSDLIKSAVNTGALGMEFSWTYYKQMNIAFCLMVANMLKKIYAGRPDDYAEALHRHSAFFNITPQLAPFVGGIAMAMEEKVARGEVEPESVNDIKAALMGPLSGIGDSFFQGTIRVIAFGLGVQLAQQGSIMGPILAMLISIVPSVLITWFAAKMGYQGGHEYLSKLQGGDLMEKLMYVCGIVGLMSVGGMIATLIGATTPLQFAEGTVVIQDILDGMMPQMISLGLTGLMYWLIKKNVNTGWLLVIAIVGGIALSAAGILA
jgi:fructoselysine and glucoselysine-specific PTS system IID component